MLARMVLGDLLAEAATVGSSSSLAPAMPSAPLSPTTGSAVVPPPQWTLSDDAAHSQYLIEVFSPSPDEAIAADIVFLHGVDGHPINTWTNKTSGFFFPRELGLALGNCRVFTAGFMNASRKYQALPLTLSSYA